MTRNLFQCKAPWTSITFQPNGVGPCCWYELDQLEKFNDPQNLFQEIRSNFLAGKIPKGCAKCEQSHREFDRGYYQSFDHYVTDFQSADIQEINLRSNNFCNLACRSCGPHFSSRWEEDFHGHVIISKDTTVTEKLSALNLKNLKTVVIAGGEPTLLSEHANLLQALIDIGHLDPYIRISTNLHSLHYKGINLLELWNKFPNLCLQVSIDAIGRHATNIRSGTDWPVVEHNLHRISKTSIDYFVNLTVSALNIWFLEETMDYLTKNFGCRVNFNLLSNPDVVNMRVIPSLYRSKINDMLDSCYSKGYEIQPIRDYLNFEDLSHLWPSFLIYNLLLDVRRGETYCQELPIFNELMKQWTKI